MPHPTIVTRETDDIARSVYRARRIRDTRLSREERKALMAIVRETKRS